MKNLKLFILLLSISLVSLSCDSDDDGSSASNKLIFGDTEYELKAGVITDYGEYDADGIYNFDISLFSSEFTIVDEEITLNDDIISGVYFELFTTNEAGLEVGTYTFSSSPIANTYDDGEVFINFNNDDDNDDDNHFDITSGSFTVLNNGSTYKLEFEGTVEGGESFSGYYKGALYAQDESSDELNRSATVSNAKSKKSVI